MSLQQKDLRTYRRMGRPDNYIIGFELFKVRMGIWRGENGGKWNLKNQDGAATVENSMEFPQKTKNGTSCDPAIPPLGLYPMNTETPIQKNL